MKTRTAVMSVLCAASLCSVATAESQRSLVGTWKGVSHTAVSGNANHHEKAGHSDVRFVRTEFTLVIEKDNGRNFAGYLNSQTHREQVIGAFSADLVNGVYVDLDGTAVIRRISNDLMQACYTHTVATSKGTGVAACLDFERQ